MNTSLISQPRTERSRTARRLTQAQSNDAGLPHTVTVWHTPLGWIAIDWSHTDHEFVTPIVHRLVFAHSDREAALAAIASATHADGQHGSSSTPHIELQTIGRLPSSCEKIVERIDDYAAGRPVTFDGIMIDDSWQTDFQRDVTTACRAIPWGSTATYGELAARAGHPKAARAVGSVMSHNRCPLIVPCHRVVPSGGKLGGFSAPGGITTKQRLLRQEGNTWI